MALPHDLQVQGQYQGGTLGCLRPLDQPRDIVSVAHHIELKPERLRSLVGDIFDGADTHGRQAKGYAKFLGGSSGQNLTVGVLHPGQACRRQCHWHSDCLARHGAGERAVSDINQDFLSEFDAGESIDVVTKR